MHTYPKQVLNKLILLGAIISLINGALNGQETFYSQKVGTHVKGSANYDCEVNQFELTSDLASIAGGSDDFQFVYRELTNDVDVKARIQSNNGTLAGLMIRSGTESHKPFALVGSSGGRTITRYRSAPSARTSNGSSMVNASWIRIRRQGNTVSSFSSRDGKSWVLVESKTINLGNKVMVGMVGVNGTTSYRNVSVIGTLDDIKVVDPGPQDPDPIVPPPSDPPPSNPDPVVPDPVVPDPVVPDPVVPDPVDPPPSDPNPATPAGGSVNPPLEVRAEAVSHNQINLSWIDNSDNESGFRIRRRQGSNGWITAATLPSDTTSFVDADLIPEAPYTYYVVALGTTEKSVPSNKARSTTLKRNVSVPVPPPVPVIPEPTVPEPTDPVPTDPVPTDPVPTDPAPVDPDPVVPADGSVNAPRELTAEAVSHNQINLSWLDNSDNETGFRIRRRQGANEWVTVVVLPSGTTSYEDTGLIPEAPYTYYIVALGSTEKSIPSNKARGTTLKQNDSVPVAPPVPVVPEPTNPEPTDPGPTDPGGIQGQPTDPVAETFSVNDIGTENLGGKASYDSKSDIFRLSALGGQIWGRKDDFHYVYREISGDVVATVKVSSLLAVDEFGKAGIMFRQSPNENARHAFLTISAGKGVALERRHEVGGGTIRSGKGNVTTPIWLRLIKEGTYISAYYSEDGDNWSFLSEDIINFPNTIFIGLAVAAHGKNDNVSADFGQLDIVELQSDSATETFISADIGKVGVNGDAVYDSATDSFIVEAAGGDIGQRNDAFHYVYREVVGDFEAVTKIDSLVAEANWAKAGLMLRETVRPAARYIGLFQAHNIGIVSQHRQQFGVGTDWAKVDGVTAPIWVKISRVGTQFRTHYSNNGTNWTLVDEATMDLPQTLLIGMAVTSHEEGSLAFGEFSSLSISN